jgi:Peptidase M50B-like
VLAVSLEFTRCQFADQSSQLPNSIGEPVGLLVLLGFAIEGIWKLAQHIGVIAHEGAHVIAGWSTGRKVAGVKLNPDGTGETDTVGPTRGFGRITTSFAGYLGPSAVGLTEAALIAHGDIEAVLWIAMIFLPVMLLLVRNIFGAISVILNGGIIFIALRYGSAELKTITAYVLSWFMLFYGLRMVLTHNTGAGDAATLRGLTLLPRFAWFVFWLAGSVGALWAGAQLLMRPA